MVSKSLSKSPVVSNYANHRYLSTPEKMNRLRAFGKKNRLLHKKMRELQKKLDKVLEADSVSINDELSNGLQEVMDDNTHLVSSQFPEDTFQSIFWKHQMESLNKVGKKKNGNRWCLYLRHFSSKAYDTICDSGCIVLPSQRTLRDYSNAVKADSGFSPQVDQQLLQAANLLLSPGYHGLTVLLLDEMHVREELVYNKHSGKLVGFVNLGDINIITLLVLRKCLNQPMTRVKQSFHLQLLWQTLLWYSWCEGFLPPSSFHMQCFLALPFMESSCSHCFGSVCLDWNV